MRLVARRRATVLIALVLTAMASVVAVHVARAATGIAPMLVPRDHPVAVQLDDGRVLVTGGGSSTYEYAEIYDPSANSWTYTDPVSSGWMPFGLDHLGIRDQAVIRLSNGRVLVAGGERGDSRPGPNVVTGIYDPQSDRWQSAALLPTPIGAARGVALPGNRAIVIGGGIGQIYDANANTWTTTSPPPFNAAVDVVTPSVLPSGRVMFTGLSDDIIGVPPTVEPLLNVVSWVYDPVANEWSSVTPPTDRMGANLVISSTSTGEVLALFENADNVVRALLYDEHTGRWRYAGNPDFPGGVAGSVQRADGGVIAYANAFPLQTRVYDEVHDLWTSGPDLATNPEPVVEAGNGRLLIFGGFPTTAAVGAYDPPTPAANGQLAGASAVAAVLAAPKAITGHVGKNLTVTGRLIRADNGAAIAGETVSLWMDMGGSWQQKQTVLTDANGTAKFTAAVIASGVWALRHQASGSATQAAADVAVTAPAVSRPTEVSVYDVQPGSGSAFLEWGAPVDDGGSLVTGYQITGGAATVHVGPAARSYAMAGLTNLRTYHLSVAPINLKGVGPARTQDVTPLSGATYNTDAGAICGLLPGGTTTWTSSQSRLAICHAGIMVASESTLVLDATSGPVDVDLLGRSPVRLAGALRTSGSTETRRVGWRPSSVPWAGLQAGTVEPASAVPTPAGAVIALTHTDLSSGSLSVNDGGGVALSDVTATRHGAGAPIVALEETPAWVDGLSLAGGGLVTTCTNPCTSSLRNIAVSGAIGTGVAVTGTGALKLQHVAVSSSGLALPVAPAVHVTGFRASVGTNGSIADLHGANNGMDAIALDGTVLGDLAWVTPSNTPVDHALGYLAESLSVWRGTMRAGAGDVVRVGHLLYVESGSLEATGPGTVITGLADPTGATPACPSTLAPQCNGKTPSWVGIVALRSDHVTVRGTTVRLAEIPLSGDLATLTVEESRFEHGEQALYRVRATNATFAHSQINDFVRGVELEADSSSFLDVQLSGPTAATDQPGYGLAVTARDHGSTVIEQVTVRGFPGTGLAVEDAVHPQIHDVTLLNNENAASLSRVEASYGPGNDVDNVIGSGNHADVMVLSGTLTANFQWISPVQHQAPLPLGYAVGDGWPEGNEKFGPGLKIPSGVTATFPRNSIVKQLGSLRLTGGSLDASAGGSVFTTFDDASVGPDIVDPFGPNTADPEGAGIQVMPDTAFGALQLTDARVNGPAGISVDARSCQMLRVTRVQVTNGSVHISGCNPHIDGLRVAHAPQSGLEVFNPTHSDTPEQGDIKHVTVTDSGYAAGGPFSAVRVADLTMSIGAVGNVDDITGAGNSADVLQLDRVTFTNDVQWLSPYNAPAVHPLGYISSSTLTVAPGQTLTMPQGAVASLSTLVLDGGFLDARAGGVRINTRGDDPSAAHEVFMNLGAGTLDVKPRGGVGGVAVNDGTANLTVFVEGPGSAPGNPQYSLTSAHTTWYRVVAAQAAVLLDHSDLIAGLLLDRANGSSVSNSYISVQRQAVDNGGPPNNSVVAIKDSQVVFSDNTILGPRGNSDVSADNSGLSLSGSTSGVFSCLDVKDSARGVVVDRSGSGLADLVISDSNLAGRTVTVDNATALTTDGVWWGQPGGPTTGQVSNPHNLNDVSPADAPVACAGAPAVTVTPPSNVHASPRAQTKMLVTWKQPDPPAGHHIVATDVVANCYGIPEALVFNGSAGSQMFNSLSGPSPPCTYHVRVVTGAGGTEAASNAAPVIVLWPTVTNIQHPSLADLTNVSSFPISAQSIVDTTVTIRVYDLNGREVRATRVAGDSGVVFANFDLRGLNEGTLYVEVSGVDAGGTSVPNATRGSFVKSTTAHPDTVQNIRPVSGNQQVIIYWSAPIDTHGRTVTSYTVTLQPGNKVKAVTQLNWPDVTFLLLKNNTVYTATITPQTSSGPLPSALTTFIPRTGWELDATPALFDLSDTRYYQADQDAIRPLGLPGDVPITGDFAGTGAQFLLWRPATGTWIALPKSSGVQWGQAGDLPVPADYNGDGKTDYAVWRPSTGSWYIRLQGTTPWGTIGDIPVPADYNGDGRTDLAVFRPSTAKWYVKGQFTSAWGRPGDIPVPGDYNGDGRAEMAVFRPSTGHWYLQSGPSFDLGSPGDVPVPAAWDNNGGTVTRAGVFHRVTATSTSTVGKTYQSSLNARNAQPVRLPYAIYQAFWNPDGSRK